MYKLRIREIEQLKTVLELYDLEIHQKKLGPDYHRSKTMVKRSIEQNIRNKNLGGELEILRRTPWSRIRKQNSVYKKFLEIVGNGKPTGSVLEETSAVSSTILLSLEKMTVECVSEFFHAAEWAKIIENPKSQRKVPMVGCLDGLARITSKELAITHFVKSGTLQNACATRPRAVANLGKSVPTHIVKLMNNLVKGPKRMITKVQ